MRRNMVFIDCEWMEVDMIVERTFLCFSLAQLYAADGHTLDHVWLR